MVMTFVEFIGGAALIVGAAALLRWISRTPTQREGTHGRPACPHCGYSTSDLVQLACPECGDYLGVIDDLGAGRRARRMRLLAAALLYGVLLGGGGELAGLAAKELFVVVQSRAAAKIVHSSGSVKTNWLGVDLEASAWRLGGPPTLPVPADRVTIEVRRMSGEPGLLEGVWTPNGWRLRCDAFDREVSMVTADEGGVREALRAAGVTIDDAPSRELGAMVFEVLTGLHRDGSSAAATTTPTKLVATSTGAATIGMPAWMGRAGVVAWALAMLGGWVWIAWRGV